MGVAEDVRGRMVEAVVPAKALHHAARIRGPFQELREALLIQGEARALGRHGAEVAGLGVGLLGRAR